MTTQELQAIKQLLQRVQLQGQEAPAYMQLLSRIDEEIKKQSE